ncbi:MAG TPA: alpha/beta hydrolase-fold protein [Candidatus Krumholzibacterium sp.]|nr:alpha/beta hydrolase-fold protein [Candidatus Krumholzibacterium sp.]
MTTLLKRCAFSLLLSVLLVPAAAFAAHGDRVVDSRILEEERKIRFRLPEGYENAEGDYDVIYMLDADMDWLWDNTCADLDSLVTACGIEDVIIVGICNTVRNRDMIPAKIEDRPETGESDAFLRFIEEELIPMVEREYKVSGRRLLFGNSNAGLFVVYAMLARPYLFDDAIAGSPMIGHCGDFMDGILDDIEDIVPYSGKSLFMIYGEDDFPRTIDYVPPYEERMKAKLTDSFRTRVVMMAGEGHVPRSTFARGIDFIYGCRR